MRDFRRTFDELAADPREKTIVDLREPAEFAAGSIPGAISLGGETERLLSLPKDKPVYLLCYRGETSDEAAEELAESGYEAYSLKGGYQSYKRHALTGRF